MSLTLTSVLAVLALVLAVAALALGWMVVQSQRQVVARYRALWGEGEQDAAEITDTVGRLAQRTQNLEQRTAHLDEQVTLVRDRVSQSLQHVAVVRYDAFGDMGGRLSFSVALVDDHGDGVVISSIHARGESRTYAKGIVRGGSEVVLTPEESQALDAARAVPTTPPQSTPQPLRAVDSAPGTADGSDPADGIRHESA